MTGISAGARLKLVFVMSDGKPTLPVLNLTVVYRPTNSIKPEPRNARTNPLLIDVDGVLIAGHGLLLAAKSIGLDSAPTITLPHLDEAQKRALRLADNKIALNAGWDVDLLKLELKELADLEIDFDLSLTGFRPARSMCCWPRREIRTTRRFPPFQPSPEPVSAISGFVDSIALVAAMAVTSTSFVRSLPTMLRSMRPS